MLESLESREMLNGDPVDLEVSQITECGSAADLVTQIAGETADQSMELSMPEEESGATEEAGESEMPEGMEGDESSTPAEVSEIEQRRIDAKNDRDTAIASLTSNVATTGTHPDDVEADERGDLAGAIESAVGICSSAVDGPRENLLTLIASAETTRDEAISDANAQKTSALATADADYAAERAGAKADLNAAVT